MDKGEVLAAGKETALDSGVARKEQKVGGDASS